MTESGARAGKFDCEAMTNRLANAIRHNPRCVSGLMANCRAFIVEIGPSGGPEALAFLGADEALANRFWYGHVLCPHDQPEVFVALLTRSSRFVNAISVPLLFARYNYWTSICPSFQPCAVRSDTDAYAEADTFEGATGALATMIARFDPVARSAREGTPFEHDALDFRILDVYGIAGARAARTPPVPAITPLRLVESAD